MGYSEKIFVTALKEVHANMLYTYSTVGFIGLGAMGFPMVENLVKKLPPVAKVFVFDVSEEALQRIANNQAEGRVHICGSSREVAESAVC